jgi:hypothetical protein
VDRVSAESLIRRYFQSWLQQDQALFLSTLAPEIKVTECYGPVYCGTDEVRQWFADWHLKSGKGKVTKWDILSILFDNDQEMAAIEWDFECVYEGNLGSFFGTSLFRFDGRAITSIQEFKMEKDQYRPYGEQDIES